MTSTPLPQLMDLMDRAQVLEDLRKAFQAEGRAVSDEALRAAVLNNEPGAFPTAQLTPVTPSGLKAHTRRYHLDPHRVLTGFLLVAVLGLGGYAGHLHQALSTLQSRAPQGFSPALPELLMPGSVVVADEDVSGSQTSEQQPFVEGFTIGPPATTGAP